MPISQQKRPQIMINSESDFGDLKSEQKHKKASSISTQSIILHADNLNSEKPLCVVSEGTNEIVSDLSKENRSGIKTPQNELIDQNAFNFNHFLNKDLSNNLYQGSNLVDQMGQTSF